MLDQRNAPNTAEEKHPVALNLLSKFKAPFIE